MVPWPGCWLVTQASTSLFRWARQQALSPAPPPFRPRGLAKEDRSYIHFTGLSYGHVHTSLPWDLLSG